jgi:hypothetical protein
MSGTKQPGRVSIGRMAIAPPSSHTLPVEILRDGVRLRTSEPATACATACTSAAGRRAPIWNPERRESLTATQATGEANQAPLIRAVVGPRQTPAEAARRIRRRGQRQPGPPVAGPDVCSQWKPGTHFPTPPASHALRCRRRSGGRRPRGDLRTPSKSHRARLLDRLRFVGGTSCAVGSRVRRGGRDLNFLVLP